MNRVQAVISCVIQIGYLPTAMIIEAVDYAFYCIRGYKWNIQMSAVSTMRLPRRKR